MSSLYPSLEDMKVDQMQKAQNAVAQHMAAPSQPQIQYPTPSQPGAPPSYASGQAHANPAYGAVTSSVSSLYPSLDDYMGLDLALVRQTTPQNQMQVRTSYGMYI